MRFYMTSLDISIQYGLHAGSGSGEYTFILPISEVCIATGDQSRFGGAE